MNVLLLYPEFPDTFWSYKHALKFVDKRAVLPPLGLVTIASMFPKDWSARLIDMNVETLDHTDLDWAEAVFISAMIVQRPSAVEVMARCRAKGVRIIAGGPLFTESPESFPDADHLVLNEAELTLPYFLDDLKQGNPKRIYKSALFATMSQSPVPRWELLNLNHYVGMSVQYSRGCPFQCDFCNVTSLLGHRVRTKSSSQIIAELDALYDLGWRDEIFFVDDNFIGNKKILKQDLLPALIRWRKKKECINFYTEASINLADDPELMALMIEAGFVRVFIGIETPQIENLVECGKMQNKHRNLINDVKKIQCAGLEVQAGFIVGFDNEKEDFSQKQIEFIQKSGIITAMVGILQAIPGTRLYDRLKKEGRIMKDDCSGDNGDGSTNIIPKMDINDLRKGYNHILQSIYSHDLFYKRIKILFRQLNPPPKKRKFQLVHLKACFLSVYLFGVISPYRWKYWNLMLWTLFNRPGLLREALTHSICGYHFRQIYNNYIKESNASKRTPTRAQKATETSAS
ncbi:radical SAM protein [Chitinispirillales bacterium ANBcel5]|uniref:B12-binding domain-containing radical SAM protein n=1 Tax=Cellulosispirillum alkaliphilum TaxID=3039283 RepID=UPI002A508BC9|nr:radical SAM protein [Chitinispirillales bacterium ANBcel5]